MTKSRGIYLLFSNSAIYAVSNLLQRSLTFLLLPIYAQFFTKAEFGAMDQLYQMVLVLSLVTSLGLPQGLVRGFYLDSQTQEGKKRILGVLVTFLLPLMFVIGIILWWSNEGISQLLFRGEGQPVWVQLSIIFYIVMLLQQLPMQLLKTNQKAKSFAFWSVMTFILIASGNIYFIVVLKWGLTGMILANIIGFGVTGLILFAGFLKEIRLNFEFSCLAPLFAFGLPMLPALLSRKILEASDRYIIPYYHNLEELGNYVMGAKIANIVEVAVLVPFLYAWQPFFYSNSENPNAPGIFAAITHYFFILLCFIFLLLNVSSGFILHFLGNGKFSEAEPVIMWLVLSVLFNGMQYCISPGIHLRKKLVQELLIMVCAASVNITLNLALIPPLKGVGAAIATAMSYFFYLVCTFILSQKHYPVPYPWLRMANVFVQTIIFYLILTWVDALAFKYVIIALYMITCPGLDLWVHGEIKNLAVRFAR